MTDQPDSQAPPPKGIITLTFDLEAVRRIIDQTRDATRFKRAHSDPSTEVPALWLVADLGVYLMSNRVTDPGEDITVVYAQEANPKTVPVKDWAPYHDALHDGDDGLDLIPLEHIDMLAKRLTAKGKTVLEIDIHGRRRVAR